MPTLQALRTERADCIDKVRAVEDREKAAGKASIDDWEPAVIEEFNALMKGASLADDAYNAKMSLTETSNRFSDMKESLLTPEPGRQRPNALTPGGAQNRIQWNSPLAPKLHRTWDRTQTSGADDYNKLWYSYVRGNESVKSKLYLPEYMAGGSTGMSTDNEERGGYFQTSEQFMTEILKQVDDAVFVQKMSRVIMMPPAKSLGVRVRRTRASTFTWMNENTDTSSTVDTSLSYGKRLLTPNYLGGSAVISRDLLRNVPGSEGMVIEEIGVNLNYTLEPAFLTGNGNFKPLGLLTASNDGISTTRDFTSGATAFSFDDWVNLKYSLKLKYRSAAKWMLHRFVLNQTALLKDGHGQYLWRPSREVGFPDQILGTEVVETEWMPYAVTSGNYFALIGDFSYYWIVYEMGMEMQRLVELRARTNEYEYLFRCKLDGQPVLEEAFSRGKRA